jgi:hypothetical protein
MPASLNSATASISTVVKEDGTLMVMTPSGPVEAAKLGLTFEAPLAASEDSRGFGKTVSAGSTRVIVKRTPTTTAGTFLNTGNVNLSPNGTVGSAGDYLRNIKAEVKAATNAGKAGIFVTQLSDAVFASGTTGSAIANSTSQTFTIPATAAVAANALADRVITFEYVPAVPAANAAKMWFTTRIVSHAAIAASGTPSSITLVLEDTPDAGAAPTSWTIHGPKAYRALAPDSAAGNYNIPCEFEAEAGGFVAWVGSGVVSAEFFGVFSG